MRSRPSHRSGLGLGGDRRPGGWESALWIASAGKGRVDHLQRDKIDGGWDRALLLRGNEEARTEHQQREEQAVQANRNEETLFLEPVHQGLPGGSWRKFILVMPFWAQRSTRAKRSPLLLFMSARM
jgi:hypothetical protein